MSDAVAGSEDSRSDRPVALAERLINAVRAGDDTTPHLDRLEGLDPSALDTVTGNRSTALAFWSNLYNAATQILLRRRPSLYASRLRIVRFFRAPALTVAGTDLSLDDIEHGILRGRAKYGLGYVPRLLPGAFERRYRLADPDPRIHFALNCGAASCPAIRVYEPVQIDDQLALATEAYLDRTVEYDPDENVAFVPRLLLWYRGDFDGRSGIMEQLKVHEAVPPAVDPTLRYRSWDWTRDARKFADDR